jgi:hypothetical protein
MKKQKGITITAFIMVAIVLMLVLVTSFKVIPVLIEYKAIERQMKSIAEDSTLRGANRPTLDRAWAMRASVETSIKSITNEQIDFQKQGDRLHVTGEYSVKVPLFWNTSACFDFKPTSD